MIGGPWDGTEVDVGEGPMAVWSFAGRPNPPRLSTHLHEGHICCSEPIERVMYRSFAIVRDDRIGALLLFVYDGAQVSR